MRQVAQIDMIREELVTEEKWISPEHFRRLLGIYQVLPGPEAHELCVHFGMMSRGRLGGVFAGLGFMLPGFVLMFLLSWGLRAGLLTFGRAYTAIPFLREDAVERGAGMSERDFLDGVALSGILPAPLIIFSTFVGYFGGGPGGAFAMTVGIFLPAFLFSILFYRHLEAVIAHPLPRHFLEGVTAGVVGLIAVTTISPGMIAIPNWKAALISVVALFVLYCWKSKLMVPAVVLAAGDCGALLFA